MRSSIARAALAVVGLALLVPAAGATAGGTHNVDGHHRRCARTFDEAQRQDMESFRDFDAETFRAVHHPDAVSIFPSGFLAQGIDEIMTALNRHFTDKNAVWSWTEMSRRVEGCESAVILYDATYDIPSIGFHQRALTAVSYIHVRGKWLGIFDQGTLLELTEG